MAAIGDIYTITDVQSYQGQRVENFYTYMLMDAQTTGTAADLAVAVKDQFVAQLLQSIRGVQVPSLTHTRCLVYNLFDNTSFIEYTYPAPVAGTQGGDPTNSFLAAEARAPRLRRDMRPGYKRYGGITEALVTGGQIAPANAVWTAITTDLNADMTTAEVIGTQYEGGNTLQPVILKRVSYPDPDDPEKTLYRLPETPVEVEFYRPVYVFLPNMTTQSSRKVGRGA